LFDFLDGEQNHEIIRTEVHCETYRRLRSGMRSLSAELRESEGSEQELSVRLGHLACSWLTAPLPFSGFPVELRAVLPSPAWVNASWGRPLVALYEDVLHAVDQLASEANPLADAMREFWRHAKESGRALRIYCYRRSRSAFDSTLRAESHSIANADYIHSLSDYRQAAIFDTLVKVGPLRATGWGAVPDAILTAPRFRSLRLFVWEGCADEAGFGYDPVESQRDSSSPGDAVSTKPQTCCAWRNTTNVIGAPTSTGQSDVLDDLTDYQRASSSEALRAATLVHLDGAKGILYPHGSKALSFDPAPRDVDAIALRTVDEVLAVGMFTIEPSVSDVDLGRVSAGQGRYSSIWKQKLARMNSADSLDLFFKLSDAGIDLENLSAAIDHWCKPPSTVIHAPKKMQHFKSLIAALDLEADNDIKTAKAPPFWRLAWDEIKHSRGHAIQAGYEESEIIAGELREILAKQIAQLAERAESGVSFEIPIPVETGIRGHFKFHRITTIEEGFRAPASVTRQLLELDTFEPWRE